MALLPQGRAELLQSGLITGNTDLATFTFLSNSPFPAIDSTE